MKIVDGWRTTFAEFGASLREKYGDWLSDYDTRRIYECTAESSACDTCNGLPCQKKINDGYVATIEVNPEIQACKVRIAPCKYLRQELHQKALKATFKAAEIPAQYKGLNFDDYDLDADNALAVEVAHNLVTRTDKGAFYYGAYGTGKTMLAAIIAQEHLRRGRTVLFSKLPDLLRGVRKTFRKESNESDIDVLERIYNVPILILDDVKPIKADKDGKEQSTFASTTLFDIVDARYNANLQTIMTSNNTLKELEVAFNVEGGVDGSRIYDRCKQMCQPVKLGGTSRRG